MGEKVVLYSDPNCPFCYALGERLLSLGVDECVEWRGVQHAPMLPIPRLTDHQRLNAMIEQEVCVVQRLAPDVPIRTLTGKPNTLPAIRAIAAMALRDVALGTAFRHRTYRGLWQRNEDISDARLLAAYVRDMGLEPLYPGPSADACIGEWAQCWDDLGVGSVPLLVKEDGEWLGGLVDEGRLAAFFGIRGNSRQHVVRDER